MTFAELQIGDEFRCYRWDGFFDPKGVVYKKIAPMKYKPSHRDYCNSTYKSPRAGLPPRTNFVKVKDTEKVEKV
jgi:hypothetical protein